MLTQASAGGVYSDRAARKIKSGFDSLSNSPVDKEKVRIWYLAAVALIGAAVTALCAYRLPGSQLNIKFAALVLITLLIGSRITIKIPGARGKIPFQTPSSSLQFCYLEPKRQCCSPRSRRFAPQYSSPGKCGWRFLRRSDGGIDIYYRLRGAPSVSCLKPAGKLFAKLHHRFMRDGLVGNTS